MPPAKEFSHVVSLESSWKFSNRNVVLLVDWVWRRQRNVAGWQYCLQYYHHSIRGLGPVGWDSAIDGHSKIQQWNDGRRHLAGEMDRQPIVHCSGECKRHVDISFARHRNSICNPWFH